ncbi:MAG: DNA polymerase III subunit beta [Parcubacteria group bacterium RIFCSPLOWO2_01_FULL_48_18]|nr:MAG: DNA polymerase III subunit beta [Parcubacteria group bacterium RIFCSPHIGHO2_02_FULL_48_10b]OHB22539.1 MAG: DNA polymerase III subunit beta [Parcubacteria group bacterium RIFCSPLOWO2_01_FULL_48_18]
MKLLILRENLKQVVGIVDRAVSNSSSLPVLRNILVIAANGTISVSATNLELAVTATLTGKITEEGSLTIPAHVFSAIVGSVSSEKIHLEKKGNSVLVKTDNYEAAIQTIHEKEFPIIPKAKNTREFIDIDGNLLRSAFDQVINAAATVSDFRQELSGVLFSFQGDSIICAATDSFRLAEKTISHAQYQTNIEKGFTVIIPAKNVQELIKILPSGTVRIHVDQNEIIFKNEEREIVSRLIEGKFPDYRNIIPTSFDFNAHVPINELLEGLKLVHVFASRLNDIKIAIADSHKTAELSSRETGLGENRYLVPIKGEGTAFEVMFNGIYFSDGLRSVAKAAKNERAFLGLNKSSRPSLIRAVEDKSLLYVLMPIRQP